MRKLNFTILIAMLMAFGTLLNAQDTVRHLVISEVRVNNWTHAYVELTNMSTTETVDLSEISYAMLRDNYPTVIKEGDEVIFTPGQELWENSTMRLAGELAPGESYLLMAVQDQMNGAGIYPRTVQSIGLLERADTVVHFDDWNRGDVRYATAPYIPEWEMWGFDSLSTNRSVVFHRHNDAPAIYWHSGDTITVLIDQALGTIQWNEDGVTGHYINNTDPPKSVAGVPDAHDDFILVRKFSIKEGETNWDLASGSDPSTSSWMLIPQNSDLGHMPFETEGNHGDFHLDYQTDMYDIDEGNNTITVPWGTEKHDSIRLGLTLGAGMSWDYVEQPDFEDSLSTVCIAGDTLELYSSGVDQELRQLQIIVADPAGDMVQAFPRKRINYPNPEDVDWSPTQTAVVGGVVYGITKNNPGIDSIFEIPFATPIDTLFKLLDIAPNATYDFVWVDGEERAELKYGDKLVITGGDGSTTKEYFLALNPIEEADNVDLRSLTWPDKPEGFWEGWKGDTVPGFQPGNISYNIDLPMGTTNVPALLVETWDVNATYTVERAVSLSGGVSERTTKIDIVSESDTTFRTVKVIFNVFNPQPQKYVADPIFSKFVIRDWWNAGGMEILNASDELIDLSNYMIVKSNETTPAGAVLGGLETDSTSWLRRYLKHVPGYKWDTYDNWQIEPGKLLIDGAVDPFVEPKDVKVWWKIHASGGWKSYFEDIDPAQGGRADIIMCNDDFDPGVFYNPWGEPLDRDNSVAMPLFPTGDVSQHNYFLFKILNDSVRSGLKAANDPMDFEVVDTWGHPIVPWVVNGITWASPPGESWSTFRKPSKYWGTTELGENFGDEENSHYDLSQDYPPNAIAPERNRNNNQKMFGSHAMDPITGHLSTVTSLVYKISRGYEGDQTLVGASRGESVTELFANLIKADPTQVLSVWNTTEKTGDDGIVETDTLVVTAQTGTVTRYVIATLALDDDNVLVPVAGSDVTVTIDGESGTVAAFANGTSLSALLEELVIPDLAVLNIVDGSGNLVPLQRLNNDTIYVDVTATTDHHLEVVAENGDIINYMLSPVVMATDAYVLSDLYTVYEEAKIVSLIKEGTTVSSFFANVTVVEGATAEVQIKSGQARMEGYLNYDDVLVVTSSDGSMVVTYELNFIEELAAYVTSDVFPVDQLEAMITVPENTTVESLVAGLSPAPQAMMTVLDVDMNEKTTGMVLETDMVKVVSGDERNETTYTIAVLISVYNSMIDNLKVYPNPASDVLYVENLPSDTNVRISDITGRMQMLKQAGELSSGVDLSGMQRGIYFLTVEKDGKVVATVKFVKK